MPKVKVPRKSTAVDMTAMCDVSFLLLTFFILTAKFKPSDPVMIDIPAARSQTKIEKAMVVSVDKDGKAYYKLSDEETRKGTLQNMIDKFGDKYPYLKTLTAQQKRKFELMENIGAPMEQLPQILSMSDAQFKDFQEKKMTGIPMDTLNNQLGDWVIAGRYANPKMKIAIKGDKFTNIQAVQRVIKIFTEKDIHRFNLITALGGAAEEPTPKKVN